MTTRTFLALALSLPIAAWSANPVEPLNRSSNGLAVKGYDVISYFTDGKATKGSAQYTFDWKNARWHFATAAHRDQFAAAPEKYAPQFGGYCAWAVGHGYTADIDPEAFSIVDGRLYLNYSKGIQKKWTPEKEKWIEEANRHWPGLHR